MEKCCSRPGYSPTPKENCDDFEVPLKCGFRNSRGLGGMVASVQNKTSYAQYAEFPWMVAVLVERSIGGKVANVYQSGGSLIHPKVAMSTAHSVAGVNPSYLMVRAGEWDTQSEGELCKHEERKVERVIRHENFVRANLKNDLVLLILNREFEMTAFINTICLPPKGMNFDNQNCFSGGWGKTKFGQAGVFQVFLKKVELPVVPRDECQDLLRATRLGEDFKLDNGFLCAGKIIFKTIKMSKFNSNS